MHRGTLPLVLALASITPVVAAGQTPDTVTVAAGPHYAGGGLKRFFFGAEYRALWTAPVRAPYLDLARTAGGLTPTTAGGGFQTKSLRFRGADGYAYGFRSIDKSLGNMPAALRGTFVEALALDQTSAQHPAAPAIVAALSAAAGLLHTNPTLVVLPDDPALGQFRERFRHTIGYFERRATIEPGVPPFAGAREIIETPELLRRMAAGPGDRVDTRQFLKARLFDLWIGDRDRHPGQWTWARFDDARPTLWVPIPEDRDQAFVRFDGFILWLTRRVTGQLVNFEAGELLNFGEGYGRIVGAAWGGRELDRRLLGDLDRPVFDSLVRDLQRRLTDAAIDSAMRQMPPEYHAIDGERLARALRARRARLPEFAERYYRMLAHEVELHATDARDVVDVDRTADGHVAVRIAASDGDAYAGRTFDTRETGEIRLYVGGGADSVTVRGPGAAPRIRIVARDAVAVIDSSRGGRVFVYVPEGSARTGGVRAVPVDRRRHDPPGGGALRDWGDQWDPIPLLAAGPDIGFLIGGGPRYTRYGFWKYPYAYAIEAKAAVATAPPTAEGDLRITWYRRNSRVRGSVLVRASGIAVLRFHGLGNTTVLTEPNEDFYRVNQQVFEVTPTVSFPLGRHGAVRLGPTARYYNTEDEPGRIIAAQQPYGSEDIGQVGMTLRVTVNAGDASLSAGGTAYPAVADLDSAFAEVHGEGTARIGTSATPLRPTLALRAGAKAIWGAFPFYEAAFIGDQRTVRLGRQNRYAGDAAVWGSAELRLRLTDITLALPGEFGVFGLADAGRVFLDGESSDTWHTAYGGGVWLSLLDPGNVLSVAIARSAEKTAVYLQLGYSY